MTAGALVLAAVTAFNLSCPVHFVQKVGKEKPFVVDAMKVIRINFASNRWCDYECVETKPIYAADDTTIVLETHSDPEIDSYGSFIISRETGALVKRSRINDLTTEETGTCKRGPFTGFPARRF